MDKEAHIGVHPPPGSAEDTKMRKGPQTGRPSMDVLQAEIEETREETIQTINELERRLSYDRIKAKVKDKAHDATIGRINNMAKKTGKTSKRWGRNLMETVKDNPLPSLMVGGGISWLIASGASGQDDDDDSEYVDAVDRRESRYVERRQTDGVDQTGTYGMGFIDRRRVVSPGTEGFEASDSNRADEIKSEARHRMGEARHKAAEVGDQVREKTARAGEQVKQTAQHIGSQAADYGHQAKRQVVRKGRKAKDGFSQFLDSNPLAVAGIVMAAGAVVGAAFPTSRYEDRKLGPARDKAIDRAREAGREQLHKVEAVAKETVEAAKEEADRQGLIDREKAEKVEQKAKEMAKEGSSKIKTRVEAMKDK
ncbi:MAG: hypothetical protein WBY88_18305 [Desulfosarcina sp.]